MEVFQGLTDDQKALVACGVALFFCSGIMVLSHSVRQWFSGKSTGHTYRYQSRVADSAKDGAGTDSQKRKAA